VILYAGGGPMTYGVGISHPITTHMTSNQVLNTMRNHYAWPSVLGRKLGMSGVKNDAHVMTDNTRIAKSLMTWVHDDWLDNNQSPDNLFVVIGWVDIKRYGHFTNDEFADISSQRLIGEYQTTLEPLVDRDIWFWWDQFIHLVIQTQAFLIQHGIRYVMFYEEQAPINHLLQFDDWKSTREFMRKYNHMVVRSNFLGFMDPDQSATSFLMDNQSNIPLLTPNGHPYADGHALWADRLHTWISQNRFHVT